MENRTCFHCGKKLVKIGRDRQGVIYGMTDYPDRKYHKKCYKEVGKKLTLEESLRKLENIREFNAMCGFC